MAKCLLCGVNGIRQPVIESKVVTAYYVPIKQGGKKVARNMFSACRFHKKLYESWATPEERIVAKILLQKHFRDIYPEWNYTMCMKEEKNEDDRV